MNVKDRGSVLRIAIILDYQFVASFSHKHFTTKARERTPLLKRNLFLQNYLINIYDGYPQKIVQRG